MPFLMHWERNGVVVSFTGFFDLEENNAAVNELYADSKINTLEYVIWDISRVESLDFSEDLVRFPAFRDKKESHHLPKIKVGFVVSDEPMAQLCLRYIIDSSVYGSPWEFNVSDRLEVIRAWISS